MPRAEPGAVREQSHKEEMSAAVRGDFARLRARREHAGATPSPAPTRQVASVAPAAAVPPPAPPEPEPPRRSFLRSLLHR